ncbi:MAG: 23S rRNA (adenine(2503)-C(2))-methyltransferase RlmN [Bacteroidales bacterium]|jgi:23S rRNA (adenine2503-C2)-methyltransferase
MNKKNLLGLDYNEIRNELSDIENIQNYNIKQIYQWIYKKHICDFDKMSNLPLALRSTLNEKFNLSYPHPVQIDVAKDGTKKYLFVFDEKKSIETAVINDKSRITICLSTQSGCRYGCKFCATGKIGFNGNLSAGEILWQLMAIDEINDFTNIVFMGMGEPLDNANAVFKAIKLFTDPEGWALSSHRITLSTIGIADKLVACIEKTKVNIAWSMHSPFDEQRLQLMPVQNIYPLQTIIDIFTEYKNHFSNHRKLTIEYLMLKDTNISLSHANELAKIAQQINARVNLIPYNPHPFSEYKTPSNQEMLQFQQLLKSKGVLATIRKSKGNEIQAACGNLSAKYKNIY